jgi:hypothetical protein
VGILGRGNSAVTTVNSGAVAAERRISFVIENDIESIHSSQTTLAVQVFPIA